MNLHKTISELQERNKKESTVAIERDFQSLPKERRTQMKVLVEALVPQLTTDTAHAVALAVIGEIRETITKLTQEHRYNTSGIDMDLIDRALVINHLTTLEEALQDKK